jgi:hypothetical protein
MFPRKLLHCPYGKPGGMSLILLLMLLNNSFAQVDSTILVPNSWKFDGTFVFNINQSSFTNWVAGGENQVGITTIVKPVLLYDNNRWSWSVNADFRYGMQKLSTDKAKKSDDVLRLELKAGRRISRNWKFSILYLFNSQLSPSYDLDNSTRLLSSFMAPAYTNASFGFDYSPDSRLSIYLTPANLRSTYVLNDSLSKAGEFGVTPGRQVLVKLGPSAYITYKDEVLKNIIIDTKLGYFQNVLDGLGDPVINWDAVITMKINKYMSTSFTFTLLFDPDSMTDIKDDYGNITGKAAKVQFKQTLGVGLNFNW